ncbi:MAG TPA: oxidoreductase [Microscillaceae bacterium]|nr:oxidoreductase [Microscillaceae bacterium]
MQYHTLGNSDLQVSEISLGCMSLKTAEAFQQMIPQALDVGINFFDTADLYDQGQNEVLLGKALGTHRKEVIVASKVGNQLNADGTSWSWNPSKAYILTAIDASLKRLGTDYIDLYQLHGGTIEDPIDETIEAFETLKQQGKIRAYGISSIRPNVIQEYVKRSNIASNMMQYSLLDRRPEETALDLLHQNNISVITRGTVAKGLLAGKPATVYLAHSEERVQAASEAIHQVAQQNQQTTAQTCARYVLQHPAVASAVMGFRTIEQLKNGIGTNEFAHLSDSDYQALQNSVEAKVYDKHRV